MTIDELRASQAKLAANLRSLGSATPGAMSDKPSPPPLPPEAEKKFFKVIKDIAGEAALSHNQLHYFFRKLTGKEVGDERGHYRFLDEYLAGEHGLHTIQAENMTIPEIVHILQNDLSRLTKANAATPVPAPLAEPAPTKPPAATLSANGDDETAYGPASELIDPDRFPDLKAINKALDANPWIRWRRPNSKKGKPIRNRKRIHLGDWHKFKLQGQTVNPLDLPAETVDAAIEAAGRQADIRKLTRGK